MKKSHRFKLLKGLAYALVAAQLFAHSAFAGGSQPANPGGSSGQIQYNNSGTFGGLASVPIAYGGSGQTTAASALAALSNGYFIDPRKYGAKCNAPNYAPATYSISSAGTGYAVGDTFILANESAFGLHVRGGLNATGHVTSISGGLSTGPITGIALDTLGNGYYTGLQGLTSTSGSGTGGFVSVNSVNTMPATPTTTLASDGNGWAIGDVFGIPNSTTGNYMTGVVTSISGGGFAGPVTGYTINNPGGDYTVASALPAVAIGGYGYGLTINVTSVTGNASNGTWDDTYGLAAAYAASATPGQSGTVLQPDQCWVQTLMIPTNGTSAMGMGWAPNYGLSDEETSGQYINPSQAAHMFMFGTPNFAIDLNQKGGTSLIGFEVRAYSLNAVNTSAGIGSYNGAGGIAFYSQLVIPNVRTYAMSAKSFKVGYGTPSGGSNCNCYINYLYVNDQNSDWGGNTYGVFGPFSDYVFANDIMASTNGGIWITTAGGGLGRIINDRIEYTAGIGVELDGGGGFQTQISGLQVDRSSLAAVYLNNASEVTMTGGVIKSGGEVGTLRVTGAASDGGLIKLTVTGWGYCPQPCGAGATSGLVTGDKITVAGVVGTTEANGVWTITVIDGSHIDLQGSTFTNAYVSGGTGGVWNKGSDILLSGTSAYDFHAVNVGFGEETGGQNIPVAFIVESKVSGSNYDYVSFQGGYAQQGFTSEGAYSQSFANWQVSQPTHYVQEVPGSLYCHTGEANFSINCATGVWTIGTLLNTSTNGTIIPTTSGDTTALLGTAETFTKNQSGGPVTLTDTSGTYTFDINSGQNLKFNLVHGETVTISNPTNIASRVGSSGIVEFVQSSTGGDTISTWGTDWKFTGGTAPTLSSGANARDYFSYYIDDSTHIVLSGGVLNAQ